MKSMGKLTKAQARGLQAMSEWSSFQSGNLVPASIVKGQTRFQLAYIVREADIETPTRRRGMEQPQRACWSIFANIPTQMWAEAGYVETETFGTVFIDRQASGRAYLCLAHDVGNDWQHRLTIPLVGKTMRTILEDVQAGAQLRLNLTCKDFDDDITLIVEIKEGDVRAEDWSDMPSKVEINDFMNEAVAYASRQFEELSSKPIEGLPLASNVCLALLLPPMFDEADPGEAGGQNEGAGC
ncbi:hypothetical protein [Roseateles albus]|uniref:Uncharacterized protein n=1 Tax=Roseateles albus TaxID=2987525 RepID=A0ABT5KCQ7_9BURK|nr:hypothetical protein [Roseateles albus]MDC8771712.1 hypothetical protein [Roseateles albus]